MQTNIKENKVRFSKMFSETTAEMVYRAEKHGWEVDVDGDKQVVFFTKEVKNGKDI